MAELVTIPISYFELAVDFRPNFKLWIDRGSIVQVVFEALSPWNPNVDDVEAISTGKISEQGFTLKLPLKRVSFFFGPVSCRFTRDAVNWESAEETITILDAAFSAFFGFSGMVMGAKRTAIAVHLQPRKLPFAELLKPFIPQLLGALESANIQTGAVVAKWDKRKVTLDGSAVVANGIYLKFDREFESFSTYQEIAHQLKKDEEELFGILGVEEDRG
jgi:hypothetical protein